MGKPTGFKEFPRKTVPYRAPLTRLDDFLEIYTDPDEEHLRTQGARCMDCGVPFCMSNTGCPIDNLIPEWNDLVYQQRWREALDRLHKTNNFPEFTGRACPAPCEGACVLGINDPPVTIKNIENAIIDRGFAEGWVQPQPPAQRTGQAGGHRRLRARRSGGRRAAEQGRPRRHRLRAGRSHRRPADVRHPEHEAGQGASSTRRVQLLEQEGIRFVTQTHVGQREDAPGGQMAQIMQERGLEIRYLDPRQLQEQYDALLLATGATRPRDLAVPGRDLQGIHFAMDFLTRNTKSLLDSQLDDGQYITARDKHVIVIGGGDTGADCIGTSLRHGCRSVVNFELLDEAAPARAANNPWPQWPRVFRVDYSHEECRDKFGDDPRKYAVLTKEFLDDGRGHVAGVRTVRVDWSKPSRPARRSAKSRGPRTSGRPTWCSSRWASSGPEQVVASELGVACDERSNYRAAYGEFATNVPGVFAAGDCRRGQSLVVWAISEGRGAARAIDEYLMGTAACLGCAGMRACPTGSVERSPAVARQLEARVGLAGEP